MSYGTFWVIVAAVALIVEIITLGLSSIWFTGGGIVAAVIAYLGGPLWLIIILVFFNAAVYTISSSAGIVMSVGIVLYLVLQIVIYKVRKQTLLAQLMGFASQYGRIQQKLILMLSA